MTRRVGATWSPRRLSHVQATRRRGPARTNTLNETGSWPRPRCQHPRRPPGSTHLPSRPRTARSVWPLASHQSLAPAHQRRPLAQTHASGAPRAAIHQPPTSIPHPATPSPTPLPAATSTTCRTHFTNESKEGLRPPTLGHPTTPRAATSASLAVPSPSASLAMQSTHALMALLALTSWPAPASSSANSPPLTPPSLTSHSSQLTPSPGPTTPAGLTPPRSVSLAREPPATSPSPWPSPRPTKDDRSPRPTRQPLPEPPATSHQPRSPTPQHRAPLRSRQPLQLHFVLILPTNQRRAPPPNAWTPDDAPGGH